MARTPKPKNTSGPGQPKVIALSGAAAASAQQRHRNVQRERETRIRPADAAHLAAHGGGQDGCRRCEQAKERGA